MLDKIRTIKYSRLSDNERYLIGLCINITPFRHKQYPTSLFYIKDGRILFEIERTVLKTILHLDNELFWGNSASNLILPIKNASELKKVINDFFNKNYDIKDSDIIIRHKENKSWKHIIRHLNSIERKHNYVK